MSETKKAAPRGENTCESLRRMGACTDAREWAAKKSLRRAWELCPTWEWLSFALRNLPAAEADAVDRKSVVTAAITLMLSVKDRPALVDAAVAVARAWQADQIDGDHARDVLRSIRQGLRERHDLAYDAASDLIYLIDPGSAFSGYSLSGSAEYACDPKGGDLNDAVIRRIIRHNVVIDWDRLEAIVAGRDSK